MKKNANANTADLTNDVEILLKDSVIAEAAAKVEARFNEAWKKLDAVSADLLDRYFNGATIKELSQSENVSEPELDAWIQRSKRELMQSLRSTFQTRN